MASIGLTIPVSTASVERSFSQMKLIKTHLSNALSDCSLSHVMKINIEAPEVLSDRHCECMAEKIKECLSLTFNHYL